MIYFPKSSKFTSKDFPGGSVSKTLSSQCRDLCLIPSQGTRSHMSQLKILHGATGCFWTLVLEKTLQSHLDCMEIKPVNAKGNQSWIFTGRTDAEAEAPILWLSDVTSWLTGKNPDAGKDWKQEEKRKTEDEMVGWHHRLTGHEFEQTLGDGEGQETLACWCSWVAKRHNLVTEQQQNINRWAVTTLPQNEES